MEIQTQYNYEKIWSDTKEDELLKIIAQEVGDVDPNGTLEYIKEVCKKGKTITAGSCRFRLQKKTENMQQKRQKVCNKKAVLLIVDDILLNTKILATILKDEYQTKIANSGFSALEQAKQEPFPDLILLNVKMPDMCGYEVMRVLKSFEQTENTPVIFITGSDTIEDEEKALRMGAVDYITKPVRPIIVKARVKTHITLKQQRDKLVYTALHDQLTGLYNRYHFQNEGNRKFSRAKRQNNRLSVIMVDIDFFKVINDNYGHLCGDNVLISVAASLNQNNRIEDFTARYGGEEFVIVLEDCSSDDAKIKAEAIRKNIEELYPDGIKVSASFGVAELTQKHETFIELLKDADEALYVAKENGRNRVVVKDEELLA